MKGMPSARNNRCRVTGTSRAVGASVWPSVLQAVEVNGRRLVSWDAAVPNITEGSPESGKEMREYPRRDPAGS